ncbi:43705_t:CDS:2 [Gigaspora margarita]|uniref:43705_t:CDS:1 n=1 Tax=Gigaspora margarita TaxID=4874 RepID=A0ABN7W8U7_GIGMA|nr:43705_t:CDS:2 [Gigaspora margarita]
MRHPSPTTTAKQTLSVIVKPQTYQLLHQEIGKGKISRFVEELIIRELSGHSKELERKQQEFQQKLIAGYKRMSEKIPKQGEIGGIENTIDFNRKREKEQNKIRPVLILSNNWQNQYSDYSVVAPLTSEEEELEHIEPFEVLIEANKENGLDRKSKILLYRLRAIDKKLRLIERKGQVGSKI